MDAQQELFTALKLNMEALGYAVYDGILPPDKTPYPFVYLGDNNSSDNATKGKIIGTVYQRIHVWSDNPRKRGTVSKMLLDLKNVCRQLERTENFGWMLVSTDQRIITDNTTKIPLLHGIIDVGMKFS